MDHRAEGPWTPDTAEPRSSVSDPHWGTKRTLAGSQSCDFEIIIRLLRIITI